MQRLLLLLESANAMLPHLDGLLRLCGSLLQDKNPKVVLTALEVLGLVTSKTGWPMRSHLASLVSTLVPMLGDKKIIIRQATIKVRIPRRKDKRKHKAKFRHAHKTLYGRAS